MNSFFIIQPKDSLSTIITEKYQELSTMSHSEIWGSLLEHITQWGLKLLAAIALYILGTWLIRRVKKILNRIFVKKSIDKSLGGFIVSFVNVSLTVLLFIIVVSILGVPTSTFAALIAAGGLAVGMALSGTLQNFAGGVMILLFKPFKVGDFIEVNNFSGTVNIIKITTTQITTVDNKVIVLPNGSLSNGNIQNYSINNTRRLEWKITISYGDDVEKAKELIVEYLNKDSRILSTPEVPFSALSDLGDSSVVILARCWVNSSDYWSVYYDINQKIYNEFPKNGLNFPFPQMDVFIKNK